MLIRPCTHGPESSLMYSYNILTPLCAWGYTQDLLACQVSGSWSDSEDGDLHVHSSTRLSSHSRQSMHSNSSHSSKGTVAAGGRGRRALFRSHTGLAARYASQEYGRCGGVEKNYELTLEQVCSPLSAPALPGARYRDSLPSLLLTINRALRAPTPSHIYSFSFSRRKTADRFYW